MHIGPVFISLVQRRQRRFMPQRRQRNAPAATMLPDRRAEASRTHRTPGALGMPPKRRQNHRAVERDLRIVGRSFMRPIETTRRADEIAFVVAYARQRNAASASSGARSSNSVSIASAPAMSPLWK